MTKRDHLQRYLVLFVQKSSLLLLLSLCNIPATFSQVTDTLPIQPTISNPDAQSASSTLKQLEQQPPKKMAKDTLPQAPKPQQVQSDSTAIPPVDEVKKGKSKLKKADYPNPKKAFLLSIIPGGGQIYNRRWIKAVVVIGGAGLLTWNTINSTQQFRRLEKAHFYRIDEDPTTVDEFTVNGVEQISTSSLLRLRDDYNKQKETSYIFIVAFLGLSGVEAFVDAHLRTFDVNDDLSMRFKPQLDIPVVGPAIFGMTMEFKIGASKAPPPRPFYQIAAAP